ncbi:CNNM domain-containing protein [Candidatus Laterigemmans baculatus]|uniref:CNNM domain-containing protein n=1 Tax=Candidatus Laterigemmans baculatus TaxID=2770505 RepID=UPI0013DC5C17|nr:CNNM domain-containing protein [Candidatus Laterigemmans baculatus]
MWQAILPWLAPMTGLMVLSGFFSGSEAALFSLRPRDRRALARTGSGGRAAVGLLEDPERLLSAVLFWNLGINMTYFAITSIVGARLESREPTAALLFTAASLMAIIFFGEMLPKSIAVLSPMRFSRIAGPLVVLAVRIVTPLLPAVQLANTIARRLIWPGFRAERELEVSDIERAIELGTGDAALAARERAALRQLMQLTEIRVDQWMLPRRHLQLHRMPLQIDALANGLPAGGYLLIIEPDSEEIISSIGIRTLRPSQLDDLGEAIEPVLYVPWSATVAYTFDALHSADRHVAAVINEYGETIGVVTIDMILEGILRLHGVGSPESGNEGGRAIEEGADVNFEVIRPGVWRVSGMMSVRRLADHLHATPPESRYVTIAGLMQEENERLPRLGDSCRWDRFELEVVETSGRGQLRVEIRETPGEGEAAG